MPGSPFTPSSPGQADRVVPTAPTTNDAATIARQLDLAAATLRAGRTPAADVRKAGEFQQVAVRALAELPGGYRQAVTARLHPETALVTRSCVKAERSPQAITSPPHIMPPWRIVAPPPPAELLGYYHDAQQRTGVHWTYLAAINLVETRMGRIRGESTAGARGPMQFLPLTWDLYTAPAATSPTLTMRSSPPPGYSGPTAHPTT